MGTWSAFYIKSTHEEAFSAVMKQFPESSIERSQGFIGITMDSFIVPELFLCNLSSHLRTDVIWLAFQSTVDAFQYYHWRLGQHVRTLVYGCKDERIWERVEGDPEPWEANIFFKPSDLELQIADALKDSYRAELRRVWKEKMLVVGQFLPSLDSRNCAHKIAAYFGLPHYG